MGEGRTERGTSQEGAGGLRETVLVLAEPAPVVIAAAAGFLRQRGLRLTLQTPFSVAFAEAARDAAPEAGREAGHPGGPAPDGAEAAGAAGQAPRPGSAAGTLPPGTGQVAAVPVQVKPEWCRVWVTVNGEGPAGAAARAYVAAHQERAAQAEREVQEIERGAYDQSRWPQHARVLRATLERQGLDEATIEERVARYKVRWEALGRKIARSSD
jgi:hypothetical protein